MLEKKGKILEEGDYSLKGEVLTKRSKSQRSVNFAKQKAEGAQCGRKESADHQDVDRAADGRLNSEPPSRGRSRLSNLRKESSEPPGKEKGGAEGNYVLGASSCPGKAWLEGGLLSRLYLGTLPSEFSLGKGEMSDRPLSPR